MEQITIKLVKETKNFFVFTDPQGVILNPIYVSKRAFNGQPPTELQVNEPHDK